MPPAKMLAKAKIPVSSTLCASRIPRYARLASTAAVGADHREHVVILGSGWAGFTLSRHLSPKKFRVTVVSPRSYFVFTPLLNSTASGTLEFRTAMEPVRNKRKLHIDFAQAWADDIDLARKVVTVEEKLIDRSSLSAATVAKQSQNSGLDLQATQKKGRVWEVPYDKLIISVGCYSNTFGTKGVKEHGFFMKDIEGARAIRKRVLQCFELSSLPTTPEAVKKALLNFAIVGGGPTGMEFAAELHDLIHQDLIKLYPHSKDYVKVTVYDVAERVLNMFDERLVEYAMDLYKREGIEIRTSHHVEELRPGLPKAVLSSDPDLEDGAGCFTLRTKEDGEVGIGMCLWSTGNMMNPFIKSVTSKSQLMPKEFSSELAGKGNSKEQEWRFNTDDRSGALIVDPHLRVQLLSSTKSQKATLPSVFALGDNSLLEGAQLPVTAQAANQEAVWLAKRLNKGDLSTASPFVFKNFGVLAYLGSNRGLFQGQRGQLSGRTAWLIWRGAYLTMSVSWRNKILIPIYWFLTWLFGRDISRF